MSWNIRGLNSPFKKHFIKCYIANLKIDILLIQETEKKKSTFDHVVRNISPFVDYCVSDVRGLLVE